MAYSDFFLNQLKYLNWFANQSLHLVYDNKAYLIRLAKSQLKKNEKKLSMIFFGWRNLAEIQSSKRHYKLLL